MVATCFNIFLQVLGTLGPHLIRSPLPIHPRSGVKSPRRCQWHSRHHRACGNRCSGCNRCRRGDGCSSGDGCSGGDGNRQGLKPESWETAGGCVHRNCPRSKRSSRWLWLLSKQPAHNRNQEENHGKFHGLQWASWQIAPVGCKAHGSFHLYVGSPG